MLEDGILMAGLLAVRHPALLAAAVAFRSNYSDWAEIYDDVGEEDRRKLYELCRSIGQETKLVVTVLDGSSLASQLAILSRYELGVEVCQSIYRREYSPWSNRIEERGTLPQ
jgi:hypothetical protein